MSEPRRGEDHVIRKAAASDAAAIAQLHVGAWQWAYGGLLPDAYLDSLSAGLARRTAWRRQQLSHGDSEERTWVVERSGAIVGFADTGPSRDEDAVHGTAELYAIYLAESATGKGIGCDLLGHALDDLHRRGYTAATLWVLTGNDRARRFYEVLGWRPDGGIKTEQGPGLVLEEMRYRIGLNR